MEFSAPFCTPKAPTLEFRVLLLSDDKVGPAAGATDGGAGDLQGDVGLDLEPEHLPVGDGPEERLRPQLDPEFGLFLRYRKT